MSSPSTVPEPEAGRLDSWKQIAAYLNKSERTVRRWQQTEGLPVHKHQHQAKGSVWAYAHEIDAWLAARRVSPQPLSEPEETAEAPQPRARRIWPLALAVAALAAGALLYLPRRTAAPAIVDPEPLTALPGTAYGAAFSPDGRQVAFFWGGGESPSGIYVKAMGAEAVTPLVTSSGGASYVYSPSWSPDGKTIAYLERAYVNSSFVARHNTQSETWLCLVDATGGPPRRLIRLTSGVLFYGNHSHLSWSKDSQRVLAPMADGARRGIHWIPVSGGEPARLTDAPAEHHHAPVLSPDRRAVVYLRQAGPDQAAVEFLYRQNLTERGEPEGEPVLLSESRTMTSGLAWPPSGGELIVCRAHSTLVGPFDSRLYRMPADAPGDAVPLGLGQCTTVAISIQPAGATLAFGSGDHMKCGLWQASVDGGEPAKPFAPSSRFDALPAYSPDGAFVAFVSNRSGRPEVWLAKRDGTDAKRLTSNSSVSSSPRWSPDGGRLVYGAAKPEPASAKESGHGLYIVPVAGGDPVPVPLGMQRASDPVWTADGEWLQYWSGRELWRVRPDGSKARKAGEYASHFLRPPSAVAGPELLYPRSASPFEIRLAPIEGPGGDRSFADGLLTPYFAASARELYFLKAADQSLYAQPLRGGAARRLRQIAIGAGRALLLGITVSPDDRNLIWAVTGEQRTDLMMVRGFQ